MKQLLALMLIFGVLLNTQGQNKKAASAANSTGIAAAAAGLGAIAAAVYYERQMREMVEQSAMEWALSNKTIENGDLVEMKLIQWEVKAVTDISSTRNLLFKYKLNDNPYEIIMFILSQGWWNEYGVQFSQVNAITIDIALWTDIMGTLATVASKDSRLIVIRNDSLQLKYTTTIQRAASNNEIEEVELNITENIDFGRLKRIRGRSLVFEISNKKELFIELVKIKGDEHIIGILENDGLLLDYNEKRINVYNKKTKDLIKMNLSAVNEIHRLLMR